VRFSIARAISDRSFLAREAAWAIFRFGKEYAAPSLPPLTRPSGGSGVLPEIGIKGNTHMLMQDDNNLDILLDWIGKHVTASVR
jgi:hypothetical protein